MTAQVVITKRTRLGPRRFTYERLEPLVYSDVQSAADALSRAKKEYQCAETWAAAIPSKSVGAIKYFYAVGMNLGDIQ